MNNKKKKNFQRYFRKLFILKEGNYECDYGFMLDSLPDNVNESLGKIVDGIQKDFSSQDPYNDKLAGEIDKEFGCAFDDTIINYIRDLVNYYEVASRGYLKSKLLSNIDYDTTYKLRHVTRQYDNFRFPVDWVPEMTIDADDTWVNFQAKNEFNPPHDHMGTLSIVIWYKIPFLKEDEIKDRKPTSGRSQIGDFYFLPKSSFEFSYRPNLHRIEVDKKFEGTICIFPSNLFHAVNPFFKSDEYRISFSSNLYIKNFGKSMDDLVEYSLRKFPIKK